MPTSVAVVDEVLTGERHEALRLALDDERVSARELIRSRVYQEVTEYNAAASGLFRGLVGPTGAERLLNGFRLRERRRIDWQAQYARALEAFGRNGFLLLVDNRQLTELDEQVTLQPDSTVTFLRLVPLVGG